MQTLVEDPVMDLSVQDLVLSVQASQLGIKTDRMLRELSLKTETGRIGEDLPNQKKMPWGGIMEDPQANGVVEVEVEMEMAMVNPAQEMVAMVEQAQEMVATVEQDGDPLLPANHLKEAVGEETHMGLSSHLEDLNGKMTVLPWAGRICPFLILEPGDHQEVQAAACHQAQG